MQKPILKERRSKTSGNYDIAYLMDDPQGSAGAIFIVLSIAIILVVGAMAADPTRRADHSEDNVARNAFNNLTKEQREAIKPLLADEPEQEQVIKYDELKNDERGLDFYGMFALILILGAFILCLVGYVIAVNIKYIKERNKRYYFFDIPLNKDYFRELWLTLFPLWIFFIVSYIYYRIALIWGIKEETQIIEEQVIQKSNEEMEAMTRGNLEKQKKANKLYVEWRTKDAKRLTEARIEELDGLISGAEQELTYYADEIRAARKKIAGCHKEKEKLEAICAQDNFARRKSAEEEFLQIAEMRGVKKIWTNSDTSTKHKKSKAKINILVEVRVPYNGDLYDFGDYVITISCANLKAKEVRCGVRADCSNTEPYYNESSGFCFGGLTGTIDGYAEKGKYLEAITVAINALHSVNNEDHERNIPKCFRKVKQIEKTEKRLKKKGVIS